MRILFQTQLSCYTPEGKFVMTADSNWQIFMAKAVAMTKINPSLQIDVIVPLATQCVEDIDAILVDAGVQDNVTLVRIPIIANAAATRFDFPYAFILDSIRKPITDYTHVYINDPMLFTHYKAMFHLNKASPKFILQTHFLDSPLGQVVDSELSYWLGTVDACKKADIFLWHSDSMQDVFSEALRREFHHTIENDMMIKSGVWKDGYSIDEIRKPVNAANVRFDTAQFDGKTIVWVPNRVGGLGKSFDYTNNGKFLFEVVPELWQQRQNFVVLTGNPNQKISNDEIAAMCPANVKLVDGPLNRDEYRWLSARADIVVGLYTNDANGGLASLEAIEFGAVPLFPDIYEYKKYFDAVDWFSSLKIKPDLSDIVNVFRTVLDSYTAPEVIERTQSLTEYIRQYASYEHITASMMQKLELTNG